MAIGDLGEVSRRGAHALAQCGHLGPMFEEEGLGVHDANISELLSEVNSDPRTHDVSGLRCNCPMDNKTIRRLNLHGLIDEYGTIEALARATGTVANYLSQIKGGSREMGDAVAKAGAADGERKGVDGLAALCVGRCNHVGHRGAADFGGVVAGGSGVVDEARSAAGRGQRRARS